MKNKGTLIFWITSLVVTLASSSVMAYYRHKDNLSTIVINAEDFLDVSYAGFNGEGYMDPEPQFSEMRKQMIAVLNDSKYEGEVTKDQITRFIDTIEYVSDKGDMDLSNGDTVNFKVNYNEEAAEALKIEIENSEWSETVEGLKEYKTIDPFEYVEPVFEGMAPNAKASLDKKEVDKRIGTLRYRFDRDEKLSQGEKVILSCISNEELLKLNGYILSTKEKEYTVEGMDYYISSPSDLSEDVLSRMKEVELNRLNEYIKHWEEVKDESERFYASEPKYLGSAVMVDNQTRWNQVIIVYSIDWTPGPENDSEPGTTYYPFRFKNVISHSDGIVDYDPNNVTDILFMRDGFYKNHKSPVCLYTDVKEMFTDVVRSKRDYSYEADDALKSLVE